MAFAFEKRAYGPESTPAEIQAIKDCIFVDEPGILYWRELPVQSDFHLRLFDDRLNELSRDMTGYRLIIDLLIATPPNAPVRASLRQVFGGQKKLMRAAVFTGKNFMLNVAARFVLTNAGLQQFAVYRTLTEAREDLRGDLARR